MTVNDEGDESVPGITAASTRAALRRRPGQDPQASLSVTLIRGARS